MVRRSLATYRELRKALEQLCEINRQQLRIARDNQGHD